MMANLITVKGVNIATKPEVTMTSLELVQLINIQRKARDAELAHSDFLKKVPLVLGGGAGKFSDTYIHPQNSQTYPCYKFPKREACLMAMSYSYDLQAKVFDRMTEMEEAVARPDPMAILSDPAALRMALLGYTETVIALEGKVAEQNAVLALQAPKVEALDTLATRTDGSVCITDAAKDLQVPPRRLFSWLQEHDWIYRRAGGSSYVAYQPRIKTGFLEHKITTIERSDGSVKMVEQVLVTAKGLAKLAIELSNRMISTHGATHG